ncbi:c-type cytochrome [Lewinella sp. IMCC34191]|uniref:c-type cytochrome n=1 Tax=Lewinella sp. IMCC34191 TaxID=2259172 RepID=UPI001E61AB37|nr:c-type cytochrome [Lewinella sp. IMCC34191]
MVPRSFFRLLYIGVTGILFTLAVICLNALDSDRMPLANTTYGYCGTPDSPFEADSLATIGYDLWRENACGSCHDSSMRRDMTAPALMGVTERWADYPREDLYHWVRRSQRLVDSGHPRAKELWAEWGPSVMSNFTNLTDEDVAALLAFIEARGRG